jgi:hypothetical protein
MLTLADVSFARDLKSRTGILACPTLVHTWRMDRHECLFHQTRNCRNLLSERKNDFDRWERGELDAFELKDQIHTFHQGAARELYARFAMNWRGMPGHYSA